MKNFLLGIFFVASAISLSAQSQRLVFLEEFTQASCGPCEQLAPRLNKIVEENAGKLVQIHYQVEFPGVDPMNKDNPEDVDNRVKYYGVTGVPAIYLDGTSTTSLQALEKDIKTRYAKPAPVAIEVSHTFNDSLTKATITVKVKNEGTKKYTPAADDKLRVAMIEEKIKWPYNPGSTGLTEFHAVLKKLYTGKNGQDMEAIEPGATWEKTWTDVDMPSKVYDFKELAIVAWIQNTGTKAVANAGLSKPIEVMGKDLASVHIEDANTDYCDKAYTPKVTIKNVGSLDVAAYEVQFILDTTLVQTVQGSNLAAGKDKEVTFDKVELGSGTNRVSYTVRSEGAKELAIFNNIAKPKIVGKIGKATSKIIDIDFENERGAFENGIVNVPTSRQSFLFIAKGDLGSSVNAGGYAASEQSLFVPFGLWNPESVDPNGSLIFDNHYSLPEGESRLRFDYAYTSWKNSNDRLIVQVSTDCGATFEEVFNKAGKDLRTREEINSEDDFFKPSASDWKTVEVDMSKYGGKDIVIGLKVVSGWGDYLYIDNISVAPGAVSTTELAADESVEVFPNPAQGFVNLSLEIVESADVTVSFVDILGRTIKKEAVGKSVMGTLNHKIDVSQMNNGLYNMIVHLGDRTIVKQVMVQQ